MNILKNSSVYLVGSIEYDPNGHEWRENITQELRQMGIKCFDPYKKPFISCVEESAENVANWKNELQKGNFDLVESFAKRIRSEDLRMVDYASFIIAYIKPLTPSFGSIEEISWACRCKKPIFIVVEGGKSNCPLWIMGMVPHKYIYSSFEEVLDKLWHINDGKIEIDTSRWKILKEEFQ